MTYVPPIALWCWALQGEDQMFFSQPTHVYLCEPPLLDEEGELLALGASETRWLGDCPCVARCQYETRFVLEDRPGDAPTGTRRLTPPIQCGMVARLDARGRFLCDYHTMRAWQCDACQGPLPHGEGGVCCEACRVAYEDARG